MWGGVAVLWSGVLCLTPKVGCGGSAGEGSGEV